MNQLTLLDKALYKLKKTAKGIKKVVARKAEEVYYQFKLFSSTFWSYEGVDLLKKEIKPLFNKESIKYFMDNIFNAKPREVLF